MPSRWRTHCWHKSPLYLQIPLPLSHSVPLPQLLRQIRRQSFRTRSHTLRRPSHSEQLLRHSEPPHWRRMPQPLPIPLPVPQIRRPESLIPLPLTQIRSRPSHCPRMSRQTPRLHWQQLPQLP